MLTSSLPWLGRWTGYVIFFVALVELGTAASPPLPPGLAAYFRLETERLESACLEGIQSRQDWEQQRGEYRRQLQEMLGLWPYPARTELKPVITGRIEQPDCVVEKLHFQSMPGLYVTANLYLPRDVSKPAPAILYVCGHALVKTNGISCGNKAGYQHHGIWLARHGYVTLLIDTVQLGEIEGLHHGTHREGMWWWNARGYSPAGVEAWNSIRALDYLETRPEVDRTRIGMTGRSGGGSYTWTTAALDDRVKVVAPVAGITDLRNHVLDGCVEGHCDCMFFVNTYRWDYPLNAALIAPRPLLLVNTDADNIFPLDGVYRTHAKVRRVYELYGKSELLGLVIGPGPHKDTQNLQVPVLRWFNQHLKGEDPPVEDSAQKRFDPLDLRVFEKLPADQINTRIHEIFVPTAAVGAQAGALGRLRRLSFAGWPADTTHLPMRELSVRTERGLRLSVHQFESHSGVSLEMWMAEPARGGRAVATEVHVLGTNEWASWLAATGLLFRGPLAKGDEAAAKACDELAAELKTARIRRVWIAPRGVGPEVWEVGTKADVHRRRRFMLLGQTLEGMRVWDVRRGIQAVTSITRKRPAPITLIARGPMGVNALYATLFEPEVKELRLTDLPASHREGPDYLNVLQVLDIPDTLALARGRLPVRLDP